MFTIKKIKSDRYINYLNHGIFIPKDVEIQRIKFIATDADGSVYGYTNRPYVAENSDGWSSIDGEYYLIAGIEYEGDWNNSLVEVETCYHL
jgi:hypothetical protein